jgi:hypothetical protein
MESKHRSKGSAFYGRVHREALQPIKVCRHCKTFRQVLNRSKSTIDLVSEGEVEPSLDSIAAMLLLVDNPSGMESGAAMRHEDQLRQRWMLLGYATRCACRLGLHDVRGPSSSLPRLF